MSVVDLLQCDGPCPRCADAANANRQGDEEHPGLGNLVEPSDCVEEGDARREEPAVAVSSMPKGVPGGDWRT